MKLAVIAFLAGLALAQPAFAQRVDTRRYEVGDGSETVACRFNAARNLKLERTRQGDRVIAVWEVEGTPAGPARSASLGLMLQPDADEAVVATAIGFVLRTQTEFASPPVRARVTVDGSQPAIEFGFHAGRKFEPGVGRFYRIEPVGRLSAQQFGEASIRSKQVGIELFDAKEAAVGRFTWDMTKSERIAELLLLTHWSCTSKDRG